MRKNDNLRGRLRLAISLPQQKLSGLEKGSFTVISIESGIPFGYF
jgi:hypothetical protein